MSCLDEHRAMVESVLSAGYEPVGGYFREMLSGENPSIPFGDEQAFLQSWESGKSDLVPCVEFASPA